MKTILLTGNNSKDLHNNRSCYQIYDITSVINISDSYIYQAFLYFEISGIWEYIAANTDDTRTNTTNHFAEGYYISANTNYVSASMNYTLNNANDKSAIENYYSAIGNEKSSINEESFTNSKNDSANAFNHSASSKYHFDKTNEDYATANYHFASANESPACTKYKFSQNKTSPVNPQTLVGPTCYQCFNNQITINASLTLKSI